jgi:hypothetical protein
VQQIPESPPPQAQNDPPAGAIQPPQPPQPPQQYRLATGLQTNQAPIPVRVTNAFGVGFFAFWGAFVASLVFWVIAVIVLGVCGGALLSTLRATPSP